MVSLTSIAVFVVIYREFSSFNLLITQSSADVASTGQSTSWTVFRTRLLLLLSGGAMIIVVTGLLWLRIAWECLNVPIRMIDRAISCLAAGKLDATVMIKPSDEFGKIGARLNELAANLQELLLFIWKQSGQCITILEKMDAHTHSGSCANAFPQQVSYQQIYESVRNLREMAQTYVFYDVRLEGKTAQAISEPGQRKQFQSIE